MARRIFSDFKQYWLILISLILMFCGRLFPTLPGLSASGMQVLCIFAGVLILWLKVAIDWPSILLLGALAFVPELKFNTILSGAYGSSTVVFLIFTFVVSYALSQTSYLKRIALSFITSRPALKSPWSFIALYFASILFLGSFISPTVLFFVYLPILEELYALLDLKKGDKFASLLMMGTVIMTGISSGMTPIAHVFPILAMTAYADMYGVVIDYSTYIAIAVPVGLLCSFLIFFVFRYFLRPDMSAFQKFDVSKLALLSARPPLQERMILLVFVIVVMMWILPSLAMMILKNGSIHDALKYLQGLGIAFPPLFGIVVLSIIKIQGKPLLKLADAMSHGVSWPSVIMCAGTTALGAAITNSEIGVTAWISQGLQPLTSSLPMISMVLVFTLWAAIQTNLSSNMVTATVVSAAALTVTANISNMNVAALIVNIGMMASYAFATPPAMPCVAIAVSSGWVNTRQMLWYGVAAMGISVLVSTFLGYPLGTLLLG